MCVKSWHITGTQLRVFFFFERINLWAFFFLRENWILKHLFKWRHKLLCVYLDNAGEMCFPNVRNYFFIRKRQCLESNIGPSSWITELITYPGSNREKHEWAKPTPRNPGIYLLPVSILYLHQCLWLISFEEKRSYLPLTYLRITCCSVTLIWLISKLKEKKVRLREVAGQWQRQESTGTGGALCRPGSLGAVWTSLPWCLSSAFAVGVWMCSHTSEAGSAHIQAIRSASLWAGTEQILQVRTFPSPQ
jgi:hypothetical protein